MIARIFCIILALSCSWGLSHPVETHAGEACEGGAFDFTTKLDDPHWKPVGIWMEYECYSDRWVYTHWYYIRPGYCSVCGTKGERFGTLPVGKQTLEDGSINYFFSTDPSEIKEMLECPNCGNLFAEVKQE